VGHKGKKPSSLYFLCNACDEFVKYSNASIQQKLQNIETQIKDILVTVNSRMTAVENKLKEVTVDVENKLLACNLYTDNKICDFSETIKDTEKKIASLEEKLATLHSTTNTAGKQEGQSKSEEKHRFNGSLKFQLRFSGVKEADEGLKYFERQQQDMNKIEKILKHLNKENCKITDCYRLGKFQKDQRRARFLLVTFSSVWDRNMILQSSRLLSNFESQVFVSPALSVKDMQIEKSLLKKRYELISSGVAREDIKIKNLKLFVKDEEINID